MRRHVDQHGSREQRGEHVRVVEARRADQEGEDEEGFADRDVERAPGEIDLQRRLGERAEEVVL